MSGFLGAVLIVFAIFMLIGIAVPSRRNRRAIENMRAIESMRNHRL